MKHSRAGKVTQINSSVWKMSDTSRDTEQSTTPGALLCVSGGTRHHNTFQTSVCMWGVITSVMTQCRGPLNKGWLRLWLQKGMGAVGGTFPLVTWQCFFLFPIHLVYNSWGFRDAFLATLITASNFHFLKGKVMLIRE